MKLSTKIFLPIILISVLLISLSGCFTPTAPTPGAGDTTGGTITGTFETPEACCMSNRDHTEGWVPLVNANVSVIDSKGVTHTTKTDSDGKYWLTDVAPGIYYVVTACCECEDREGVYKDVVEEKLEEGETYDAGIADCESTALGLMVDFLLSGDVFTVEDCNCYCNCFDEESQIYASLVTTGVKLRVAAVNLLNPATKPLDKIRANADFQGFVVELCDLLEACCVEPGVAPPTGGTPPPPPPTKYTLTLLADPAEGAASFTGAGTHNPGVVASVDTTPNPCYEFTEWTVDVGNPANVSGDLNTTPLSVTMNENMTLTAHFTCPDVDPDLIIDISGPPEELTNAYGLTKAPTPDVIICMDECATINSVTVNSECQEEGVFPMILTPPYDPSVLTFGYDDTNISFDYTSGDICLKNGVEGNIGTYPIIVTYIDPCGFGAATGTVYVEFEDCSCVPPTAEVDGPYTETVCPDETATIAFNSTVTSGTVPFTYAWDFGDGGTSTDADPSHTYPIGVEVYNVTLVVTNDCGSVELETTVTITEITPPTADAGDDQCIQLRCVSEVEVFFDGSGSSGAGLTYAWDFGDPDDPTPGTGSNPSHTYPAGTYNVALTVTDICGSSDTDTMVLTIHSSCGNLPYQLTISYSNTAVNYYLNVKFSDGGGDILDDYIYHGWCAHRYELGIPWPGDVMYAYCTLELDKYWNKINWIINNRDGYSRMAVQWAIWHYIHNIDPGSSSSLVNSEAWELINAADLHGDFCPGIGDKYVVLLTFFEIDTYGGLYKCHHEQNIMIEVDWVDHCPPQVD